MEDTDRSLGRGSELFVGMLVVAFLVFLLWFLLLRPQDPNEVEPAPTQAPVVSPTAVIDDPNRAFEIVIATPTPNPTPTATPVARPTPTPTPLVYAVQGGRHAVGHRGAVWFDGGRTRASQPAGRPRQLADRAAAHDPIRIDARTQAFE